MPQIVLFLVLLLAIPVTYGVMWAEKQIAVTRALARGEEIGKGAAAAAMTAKAAQTVADVQRGEAEAPPVPPERAKLLELCSRSASCRDRSTVKGKQ